MSVILSFHQAAKEGSSRTRYGSFIIVFFFPHFVLIKSFIIAWASVSLLLMRVRYEKFYVRMLLLSAIYNYIKLYIIICRVDSAELFFFSSNRTSELFVMPRILFDTIVPLCVWCVQVHYTDSSGVRRVETSPSHSQVGKRGMSARVNPCVRCRSHAINAVWHRALDSI